MSPLILRLRAAPEQRLDLSPLTLQRLAGLAEREISCVELQTTRRQIRVGDVFDISFGSAEEIVFEGGSERFDRVGQDMNAGSILIEGDVGERAGRRMAGGRLTINGAAGPYAASGMSAGLIEIAGDAGDRLGAPLAGEIEGMNGGVVVVRGDAGARAADRLRRGAIIIEGKAGDDAGSRMLAGTLIVRGGVGRRAGYLMRRGTIVLGATVEDLGPTFLDCGAHDLVALRLMANYVGDFSSRSAAVLRAPLRRFCGDNAVLGKGEIFVVA